MKAVALIPLLTRSSLKLPAPGRPVAGRPLCDWALRPLVDSGIFAEVIAAVDDETVGQIAEKSGAATWAPPEEVRTLNELLIQFAEQHLEADVFAVVHPGALLHHPQDFRLAMEAFEKEKVDSLVAVTKRHILLWEEDGTAINHDPQTDPDGWGADGEMVETGGFTISTREVVDDTDGRLAGRIGLYEVPRARSFRIEDEDDCAVAEILARRHGYAPVEKKISLLVLDVDGVLTDAGFYYSEEGEMMKKFNTRDGQGIVLARQAGVEFGIITGETTGFTRARADKLQIGRLELGSKDKLPVLDRWREELGFEWDEVAYMGDDLPDLPCLRAAGVGACPADAEPEVLAAADYISPMKGGQGAVRDFIRWLNATGRIEIPPL